MNPPNINVFETSTPKDATTQLSFRTLPYGVQKMMMWKLGMESFSEFIRASRFTQKLAKAVNIRNTLSAFRIEITEKKWWIIAPGSDDVFTEEKNMLWQTVHRCNFRVKSDFIKIHCELTDKFAMKLINKLRKCQTKAKSLVIYEQITCSLDKLITLINILEIQEFEAEACGVDNLLEIPEINKMKNLSIFGQKCSPKTFLDLRLDNAVLQISDLSATTVVTALQQWQKGRRELDYLELILPNNTINQIVSLLPGIGANVIWTPDDHENSFIHMLDKNNLYFADRRLYNIQRPTGEAYLLDIVDGSLKFGRMTHGGEKETILRLLRPDQYIQVTGICRSCGYDCRQSAFHIRLIRSRPN